MQRRHEDIDTFQNVMFMPVVVTSGFSSTVVEIGVHSSYIPPLTLSSDLLAGHNTVNMLGHNGHITVLPPDL
jgi:hypothetical protein